MNTNKDITYVILETLKTSCICEVNNLRRKERAQFNNYQNFVKIYIICYWLYTSLDKVWFSQPPAV